MKRSRLTALLPFFLLAAGMLVWHLTRTFYFSDDVWFLHALGGSERLADGWLAFLAERYTGWSSRLVIEAVLVLLVHFPMAWRLLDTAVTVVIGLCLSRLCNPEKRQAVDWAIVGSVFLLPLSTLSSAGWIASTLNYLWPLAGALVALLPAGALLHREKCPPALWIAAVPALLYAANLEQMCALLAGVLLLLIGYLLWRDRRIHPFLLVELALIALSLLFILTCSGNAVRSAAEIAAHFPAFPTLTLWDKLEMGYSSTLYYLLMRPNPVVLLFTLLPAGLIWSRRAGLPARIVSVIPPAAVVLAPMLSVWLAPQPTSPAVPLLALLLTPVVLAAFTGLLLAFEKIPTRLIALCLLALGGGSRVMMGFSPTIWLSGERTCFFLYAVLLALSLLLWREYQTKAPRTLRAAVLTLWLGLGGMVLIFHILSRP